VGPQDAGVKHVVMFGALETLDIAFLRTGDYMSGAYDFIVT
jgi:hypothetical protein